MADMIDAAAAKKLLGCDDATLNNHVNNGTIRAQRQGGKLMLNRQDVEKLAGGSGAAGDDDGTIVLTGDSDDLSIDLGKVVDDSAETIVQQGGKKGEAGTESITFGDELEVVSFDDSHTSELVFDETKPTGQQGNLNFTDSNTAVVTAVEETAVGATTAPIDFQTSGEQQALSASSVSERSSASARRSVRATRAAAPPPKTHWIWSTILILTMLIFALMVIPYYVIELYHLDAEPGTADPRAGASRLGRSVHRAVDDGFYVDAASAFAGFTVEPDQEKWKQTHDGDAQFIPISQERDRQGKDFRYRLYQGDFRKGGERLERFVITEVAPDGSSPKNAAGQLFPTTTVTSPVPSPTPDAPPTPPEPGTEPAPGTPPVSTAATKVQVWTSP